MAFFQPWNLGESGKFHLKYKAYSAGIALNIIATSQPYFGITKYEIRAAINHPPAQKLSNNTTILPRSCASTLSDTNVEATGSSPLAPYRLKILKQGT